MKQFRFILLFLGVFVLAAAVSGVNRVQYSSDTGFHIYRIQGLWPRILPGLFGIGLIGGAMLKGFRFWLFGSVVFGLLILALFIQTILGVIHAGGTLERLWVAASQSALVGGFILFLIKWWVPKRKDIRDT